MIRQLLIFATLALMMGQVGAQITSETLTLALPAGKERLQVELVVADEQPGARWRAFLKRWFEHFDSDGDGKLTPREAARIFPLAIPGKSVAFDFKSADTNGDGLVTPVELSTYYQARGFTPVLTVVEPVSLLNVQIAEAFFRHLIPDENGRLTLEKFKRAPDLLRKLDENEDEVLTSAEILSRGVDPALKAPARSEFAWLPAQKQAGPAIRLDFGAADGHPLRVHVAGDALKALSSVDAPVRVRHQRALLAFSRSDIDPGKVAAASRHFVLAQFRSIAGKTLAIDKRQVVDDPSLQLLADIFPHADRNQDGILTAAELENFLDLLEQGVRCQILVTLSDHGRNLFLNLDANADGRLDFRELNSAAAQVAALGGGQGWTRDQVPHCAHIRVQVGFAAEAFGPLPLAIPARTSQTVPVKRSAAGPAWFQAMDKNGDGFVSPREFLGPIELFRQLDRNGDGLISVEEAEKAEGMQRK